MRRFNLKISNRFSEVFSLFFFSSVILGSVFQLYSNLTSQFWMDEVFTDAMSCQRSFFDTLSITAGDVHPPLYAEAVHFIFYLFGCDITYARYLSLVVVLTSVAYFIFKRGLKNSSFFVFIIFLMPPFWFYSLEARSYSFVLAFSIAAVSVWDSENEKEIIKGFVFCILAASFHYIAIVLPIIYIIFTVSCFERSEKYKKYVFFLGFLIITYYVWAIFRFFPPIKNGFWIEKPKFAEIYKIFSYFFGNFTLAGIFFVLCLVRACFCEKIYKKNMIFGFFSSVSVVLLMFFVSYFQPIFVYRYVLFLVPVLAYSCSKVIEDIFSSQNGGILKVAVFVFLCFFSFIYLLDSIEGEGDSLRTVEWTSAAKYSVCAKEKCGFVFNDPALPAFTQNQYKYLANVLFKKGVSAEFSNTWDAIRPKDFNSWEKSNKGRNFVFMGGVGVIKEKIKTKEVVCEEFKKNRKIMICKVGS